MPPMTSSMLPLGTKAPRFRLPDPQGKLVSSDDFPGAPALLVAFICNHCPYVKHVRPVLEKMGNRIYHCGSIGAGHALKALNNYIGAAGTIAAFEAVLVGKAFGLDPALMVDVINNSTGYNSTTQRKLPQQVLTNAFASGFSAALMTKDVGIAEGIAGAMKVPAPYLRQTLKLWREALRRLPPGADHTEMYRFLEKLRSPSRAAAAPRPKKRQKRRRST